MQLCSPIACVYFIRFFLLPPLCQEYYVLYDPSSLCRVSGGVYVCICYDAFQLCSALALILFLVSKKKTTLKGVFLLHMRIICCTQNRNQPTVSFVKGRKLFTCNETQCMIFVLVFNVPHCHIQNKLKNEQLRLGIKYGNHVWKCIFQQRCQIVQHSKWYCFSVISFNSNLKFWIFISNYIKYPNVMFIELKGSTFFHEIHQGVVLLICGGANRIYFVYLRVENEVFPISRSQSQVFLVRLWHCRTFI